MQKRAPLVFTYFLRVQYFLPAEHVVLASSQECEHLVLVNASGQSRDKDKIFLNTNFRFMWQTVLRPVVYHREEAGKQPPRGILSHAGFLTSILLQGCILCLEEMLPTSLELLCTFMCFFPHTLSLLGSWTPWTAAATVSLSSAPERVMSPSSLHPMCSRRLPPPPRSMATALQPKCAPPRRALLSWMGLLQSASW